MCIWANAQLNRSLVEIERKKQVKQKISTREASQERKRSTHYYALAMGNSQEPSPRVAVDPIEKKKVHCFKGKFIPVLTLVRLCYIRVYCLSLCLARYFFKAAGALEINRFNSFFFEISGKVWRACENTIVLSSTNDVHSFLLTSTFLRFTCHLCQMLPGVRQESFNFPNLFNYLC